MTKYHVTNLLSKDEITACFNVHLSGYKKEKVVHLLLLHKLELYGIVNR